MVTYRGLVCTHAGWDVFSLRYSVDEPLATVLTDAAAAQIQAVARLLWALKRAEHSLSAAWLLLNTTQRSLTRLAAKSRRLHVSSRGICPILPAAPCLRHDTGASQKDTSTRLNSVCSATSMHIPCTGRWNKTHAREPYRFI